MLCAVLGTENCLGWTELQHMGLVCSSSLMDCGLPHSLSQLLLQDLCAITSKQDEQMEPVGSTSHA